MAQAIRAILLRARWQQAWRGAAIPKVTHAFLAAGTFGVAQAMSLPPPKNNKLHSPHCPLKSRVAEADHGNPEIFRVNSAVVF
jgi:hypothetical protein